MRKKKREEKEIHVDIPDVVMEEIRKAEEEFETCQDLVESQKKEIREGMKSILKNELDFWENLVDSPPINKCTKCKENIYDTNAEHWEKGKPYHRDCRPGRGKKGY